MKNKINRIFETIIITTLLVMLAGCAGAASPSAKNADDGFVVIGNIILGTQNTASSRSATASLSGAAASNGSFALIAKKSGLENVEGTVEQTDNGTIKYKVSLPEAGTWTFEVTFKVDNVLSASGSSIVEVTKNNNSLNTIVLVPVINEDAYGNIKLKIHSTAASVQRAEWVWIDQPPSRKITNQIQTFEDSTAVFTFERVPAGSYRFKICIYDSFSNELFSCNEAVTVFQNMLTDSWYGNSIYLKKNNTTGEYSFEITDDLLDSYSPVQELSISETNTPYVLWSNEPVEAIEFSIGDLGPELTYPSYSNETGYQVFNSLNGNTSITEPLFEYINDFCFGGSRLWVIDTNNTLYAYRLSYNGLVIDNDSFVNLNEKISSIKSKLGEMLPNPDSEVTEPQFTTFTYYNNTLFIVFKIAIYNPKDYYNPYTFYHYFAAYNLSTGTIKVSSDYIAFENIRRIAVSALPDSNPTEYVLYYTALDSLYRSIFTISDSDIQFDSEPDDEQFDVNNATFFGKEHNIISMSDIKIKQVFENNTYKTYLYLLIYARAETAKTMYNNSDRLSTIYDRPWYLSNGGVLKFDITNSSVSPVNWDNAGTKVLGWYEEESERDYYMIGDIKISQGESFCIQPPLEEQNEYFYGPRRFIAIKPDELVIADDGAYIESNDNFEAKNRVVTVNLLDNSISATDVDATFTEKFIASGSDVATQL